MPLPARFESYKDFVIIPMSVEVDSVEMDSIKWTIGGFIRPRDAKSESEESFLQRGNFALTHDDAIERAMVYGKKLINDRACR